MSNIRPYKVKVPDADIQDLHERLSRTKFPDELDGSGWDYGVPLSNVKRLAVHRKNTFDWRKSEREINAFPTFMATVNLPHFDPLEICFIHIKSSAPNAIPLLYIHGWPGTNMEATRLLPLLADVEENGGPAFDIISPSLPNYGWSSGVQQRGFGLAQYADTMNELMLGLGYTEYAIQAGDWGTIISRIAAKRHSNVKVIHMNLIPSPPPSVTSPIKFVTFLASYFLGLYSKEDQAGLDRMQYYQKNLEGYRWMQKTKPQTLGYGLADSPVAVLAWIYANLHEWTDDYPWTDDEVCAWVSMYWFSRAGTTASTRIYKEGRTGEYHDEENVPLPDTKLGCAYFPKEVCRLPMPWAPSLGNVVYQKQHPRGGHFAAWEVPEFIVEDLVAMFGKGGCAYEAIAGRSGYI